MVLLQRPSLLLLLVVWLLLILLSADHHVVDAKINGNNNIDDITIDNNTNNNNNASIISGVRVPFGKYPYFATPNTETFCGATLIHPDVLLTAAHCKIAFLYAGAIAYIGGTTRFPFNAPDNRVIRGIVAHPGYTESTFRNDIMLVFLETASTATLAAYNINATTPPVGQSTVVIGHGKTSNSVSSVSKDLLEGQVRIESFATCDAQYTTPIVDTEILCIARNPGFACSGDSGGPLFDNVTGAVAGLVSFGDANCFSVRPDIYTRVSFHTTWIQSTICALSRVAPTNINCTSITPPFGPPRLETPPVSSPDDDDIFGGDDDIFGGGDDVAFPDTACNALGSDDDFFYCNGDNLMRRRFFFLFCQERCIPEERVQRRLRWGWRCGRC